MDFPRNLVCNGLFFAVTTLEATLLILRSEPSGLSEITQRSEACQRLGLVLKGRDNVCNRITRSTARTRPHGQSNFRGPPRRLRENYASKIALIPELSDCVRS